MSRKWNRSAAHKRKRDLSRDDAEWCMPATEEQLRMLRHMIGYRGSMQDMRTGKARPLIDEFYVRVMAPRGGRKSVPLKDRPPTPGQLTELYIASSARAQAGASASVPTASCPIHSGLLTSWASAQPAGSEKASSPQSKLKGRREPARTAAPGESPELPGQHVAAAIMTSPSWCTARMEPKS